MNGNKVAVRVAFGYGCEVMRGNLTQIGIIVTPTQAFRSMLAARCSMLNAQSRVARAKQENRKPYFMRYQENRPAGF